MFQKHATATSTPQSNSIQFDSCDLHWLDVFLLLETISNFISLLNYKYQFVSFKSYIGWNSLTWELPTYILLWLSIRIIGKIAKTKLIFLLERKFFTKILNQEYFFVCLRFVTWFTDIHQTKCIICDNYWSVSSER